METATGIVFAACTAMLQAISYIFSGFAVRRHGELGAIGLLARTHIFIAAVSLAALPFLWLPQLAEQPLAYLPNAALTIVFYMIGQTGLFLAQRKIDASRAIPMLGMKIACLALINAFIFRIANYSSLQWIAVSLTIFSAFLMNKAGRSMPLDGIGWICMACIGYSLSDAYMLKLSSSLIEIGIGGTMRCAILSGIMSNTVAGIFALVIMAFVKKAPDWKVWRYTSPYGFCWMVAMMFLYASFPKIGTVGGNIIQNTRGILVILLSLVLVKFGFTELEEKTDKVIFFRRLGAAALMLTAIILFNLK